MNIQVQTTLRKVLDFLELLKQHHIAYRLNHIRDWILVEVAVLGSRWEIEFFDNGHVEVERFFSQGEIGDETLLAELIATHGDRD